MQINALREKVVLTSYINDCCPDQTQFKLCYAVQSCMFCLNIVAFLPPYQGMKKCFAEITFEQIVLIFLIGRSVFHIRFFSLLNS